MLLSARFIARKCVEADRVNAAEYAFFYTRIISLQMTKQCFDFLSLGTTSAVIAACAVLRKPARALYKFQIVISLPIENILLVDAIHRTDELHSLEVFAVKLRHHRLQLRAVKHRHNSCFYHITHMMAERDFITAKLLCLCI